MPYLITLTNGTPYANVADGTINNETNMVLIGKDFAGYGQYLDQNIIRLLENNASDTPPLGRRVLLGETWYDGTLKQLKVAYASSNNATLNIFGGVGPARYVRLMANSTVVSEMNTIVPDYIQANAYPGDLWYWQVPGSNTANIESANRNQIRMYSGADSDDINVAWPVVGPLNSDTDITVRNLTVVGMGTINDLDANVGYIDLLTSNTLITANSIDTSNISISRWANITGNIIANNDNDLDRANMRTLNVEGTQNVYTDGQVYSWLYRARDTGEASERTAGQQTVNQVPLEIMGQPSGNASQRGNTIAPPPEANSQYFPGFYGNVFAPFVYAKDIGNVLTVDIAPGVGGTYLPGGAYLPGMTSNQISGGSNLIASDLQITRFHGFFAGNDNFSWRQPFIRSIGSNSNVANITTGYTMNSAIWTESLSSASIANPQYGRGNTAQGLAISNVGYYGPNGNVISGEFVGNLRGQILGTVTADINANTANISANYYFANRIVFPSDNSDIGPNANIAIYAPGNSAYFNTLYASSLVVRTGDTDGNIDIQGDTLFRDDVTVFGNLTVQGDVTFNDQENTVIVDKTIQIAANVTTDAGLDGAGILFGGTVGSDNGLFNLEYQHEIQGGAGTGLSALAVYQENFKVYGRLFVEGDGSSNPAIELKDGTPISGQLGSDDFRSDAYINNINLNEEINSNWPGAARDREFPQNMPPNSIGRHQIAASTTYSIWVADSTTSGRSPSGQQSISGTQYGSVPEELGQDRVLALVGSPQSDPNTFRWSVPVRDRDGVIYAISNQAFYADLAEKYLLDQEYAPGTLLAVGGEAEATACTTDMTPFGIVSTNPAFKMNGALEGGIFVGLKGRLPTRVVGTIRKGQKLGPSHIPGVATVNETNWVAIALDNYNSDDEGVIEAIVM